ncbi:MAG: alpha/beta fold hydrolase [Pseudomonadota bacterium]
MICFPFAGGSAGAWSDLHKNMSEMASVLPYEMPGRGTRFLQPCETDRNRLVARIADDLRPFCGGNQQLVLMGHSMGAVLAYEVGLKLGGNIPLIVSGRAAPGLSTRVTDLSDQALITRMRDFGGTSTEILECPEMLDVLLPIMRADYQLVTSQSDVMRPYIGPVLALGGRDDHTVPINKLAAWSRYCKDLQTAVFPGGHFFINRQLNATCDCMKNWLATI